MKGQIVDASIVNVPKQRNSREENAKIKAGEIQEDWPENKRRQKNVDVRWTKKNGRNFYGYKNHVSVDVKHKLIRGYAVTDAAQHDSQVCLSRFFPKTRARTCGRIRLVDRRTCWNVWRKMDFANISSVKGAVIVH